MQHKCIGRVDGFTPGRTYEETGREYGRITLTDDSGTPRAVGAYLFADSFERIPGTRTRADVIRIMRDHGLYVAPLADNGIALTDNQGTPYDAVYWDAARQRVIEDENKDFTLAGWLGYERM